MPERLKAILDKITAWWKKFNTKQRSVLISIAAVVIVALVILGVVISRPTQVELVEAQSASEASTIKGVLEDNNISYEVDSKLVFFVNKSDEVNAIMALGDNGIPAQAYSIDNVTDGSFSTTEADKQKKYQVYLEDKLKDHLEKQSYVNEASVDITMPDKDGTILKSKEEATAAVTLGLKDSITDDQAYAIARLVATALGNDTTKGITIIDKKANVLYSGGDSDTSAGLATSQLSYKQKLEGQVKNEVKKTLESSNIFSNIEVGMNLWFTDQAHRILRMRSLICHSVFMLHQARALINWSMQLPTYLRLIRLREKKSPSFTWRVKQSRQHRLLKRQKRQIRKKKRKRLLLQRQNLQSQKLQITLKSRLFLIKKLLQAEQSE